MTAPPPTVLVVDDLVWVRKVLSASLQNDGFKVLLAENGQQALQLCQRTGLVSVALVDKRLPDMTGRELLAALWQLNPRIRCALMSGGPTDAADEELERLGKVLVFRKPFPLVEMTHTLWKLLGEAGGAH